MLLGEATIEVESELEEVGVEVAGLKATVMFLQWQCGVRYRLIHLLLIGLGIFLMPRKLKGYDTLELFQYFH